MPKARFRKNIERLIHARENALLEKDAREVASQIMREFREDPETDIELEGKTKEGKPRRLIIRIKNPEDHTPTANRKVRRMHATGRDIAIQKYLANQKKLEGAVKRRRQFPMGTVRRLLAGPRANIRLWQQRRNTTRRK